MLIVLQCPLKVRGSYVTSSVTILEQKTGPQFIFGLDNLSRHQVCLLIWIPCAMNPFAVAALFILY